MESIDMLIAFSLVAFFMLGVYFLSYYFAESSKQTEAAAASMLDAQEVLKKILQSPGDPSGWTDLNQINSLGLADPKLPGMLDPRKLMSLATADPDLAQKIASAACRINAAKEDYPVTKVGYGIYVWGAPTPTSVDPSVYERILRSLFGDDWSKYDIELRIRPALKINVTLAGSQVRVKVDPPGVYDVDVCYVAWPGGTSANPEPPGVYIRGAYVWTQGKNYYARVDVENTGGPAVITKVEVGNVVIFSGSKQLGSYCKWSFEWPTQGTSKTNPCGSSECYARVTFTNATGTYTVPAPVTFGKPLGAFKPGCYTPDVTTPISACASGQTGEDGRGSVSVSGLSLFAYAYVRGVMLKGVNYTYAGSGTVSLVGLVAKPDAGVYVVHSKLIQNAGEGASLCGCDDPGVSALGIRYFGVFLGGQSVPLLQNVRLNPSSQFDLGELCGGSGMERGGCLIPWDRIRRAKFLIAAVSRNSQGQPPKCGGIPQNDVIVMPLAGGLPPLYEVHFATWRRWVGRQPEALAVSHASAVADAGEITYVVDLWVFRYP
jgi:hypothetical protein